MRATRDRVRHLDAELRDRVRVVPLRLRVLDRARARRDRAPRRRRAVVAVDLRAAARDAGSRARPRDGARLRARDARRSARPRSWPGSSRIGSAKRRRRCGCAPPASSTASAGSRGRSPHATLLLRRPDHRRARLARECVRELGHVRQRADHAELRDRVRIALNHQALLLDPDRVAAELAPRDEELLIRREAVDGRPGARASALWNARYARFAPPESPIDSPSTSLPLWWTFGYDQTAVPVPATGMPIGFTNSQAMVCIGKNKCIGIIAFTHQNSGRIRPFIKWFARVGCGTLR